MATTKQINTTILGIYTGTTPGVKITYQNDASLSISHSPRDITTKDSAGWAEALEGLRSWEMSCSGQLAFDATSGTGAIYTANIATRALVTIYFTTNVPGDKVYSGTAWVTQIELASPGQEETATYSLSFQGTAAITLGTVA